jgi:hypothetical protein
MGNTTNVKAGTAVLLVAAAGEVVASLVASQNNDGTLNLVHVSTDKSKHSLLGSADFHHALDRKFGIPHGLDKFNELQTFNNEQAKKAGTIAEVVDQHDVLANTHDVWVFDSEISTSTDDKGVTLVSGFYFAEDAVMPYIPPPPATPAADVNPTTTPAATANQAAPAETATAASGGDAA